MMASVVCLAIAAVPGAGAGPGPYHLLPFLPSMVWAFFVVRHSASGGLAAVGAKATFDVTSLCLIAALVIGYGPIVLSSWQKILNRYPSIPLIRTGIEEIEQAIDNNPALRIAVGPGKGVYFDASALRKH